jgi:hypothetical protein
VDVLSGRDLLLTPAREREITVAALTRLYWEWDRWQPHEMLRRKYHAGAQNSPADMFHVMMEFLEEYITRVKEEG